MKPRTASGWISDTLTIQAHMLFIIERLELIHPLFPSPADRGDGIGFGRFYDYPTDSIGIERCGE
jgi:hypothetical protein